MTYSVNVSRAELRGAMKLLSGMIPKKEPAAAVISFDDGDLLIELPGGAMAVAAVGDWPGTVRVKSEVILRLWRTLPEGDPLQISVRGGRFYVGDGFSVGCELSSADGYSIGLPLDPPLWAVLGLKFAHTDDAIEAAGLRPRLHQAEERAAKLIARAVDSLAPLGVGPSDVEAFVEDVIRRKNSE
jgi:hypothetical protein